MNKQKIILIATLSTGIILFCLLWSNGNFQTLRRALFNQCYPEEIQKIEDNIVVFDLSKKKPARLAIGIRYPSNYNLTEIDNYKIAGEVKVKLYEDDKLIETHSINRIDRVYWDFGDSGYRVAVFHSFVWSPNVIMQPKAKLEVDLNNKFKNLELILFDYGIK